MCVTADTVRFTSAEFQTTPSLVHHAAPLAEAAAAGPLAACSAAQSAYSAVYSMLGVVKAARWLSDTIHSARCARSELLSLDEVKLATGNEIPTRFDHCRQDEDSTVS